MEKVDGGVQAEASFVGAERRVELHTKSSINLGFALIILPDHPELQDTLGDLDDVEGFLVLWVSLYERSQTVRELIQGLFEFGFNWKYHDI
jgi:hypothetical protein